MEQPIVENEKRFDYFVEETPYYRPPVAYHMPQGGVTDAPTEQKPKSSLGGKLGLYALAGVIGVLTLGSVILSED
jgi:hypothetical protein